MIKKEYIQPEITEYGIRLESSIMVPSLEAHHPTDPDIEDIDGEIDENW